MISSCVKPVAELWGAYKAQIMHTYIADYFEGGHNWGIFLQQQQINMFTVARTVGRCTCCKI